LIFSIYELARRMQPGNQQARINLKFIIHNNNFIIIYIGVYNDGIAQSVQRLAAGYTVRRSKPVGDYIFRTRLDQPWGPSSLLYNGYRVSFPGVRRPERDVDHPSSSSAEVKEGVELYVYSPSELPWPAVTVTALLSVTIYII
jgi:hypothetical protein